MTAYKEHAPAYCTYEGMFRPIENWTSHGMRRGAILLMIMAGAQEMEAKESCGLKHGETISYYIENLRGAIEKYRSDTRGMFEHLLLNYKPNVLQIQMLEGSRSSFATIVLWKSRFAHYFSPQVYKVEKISYTARHVVDIEKKFMAYKGELTVIGNTLGEFDIKTLLKERSRDDLRAFGAHLRRVSTVLEEVTDEFFPLEELQRSTQHENLLPSEIKVWSILMDEAKESFQNNSLPFTSRIKGFLSLMNANADFRNLVRDTGIITYGDFIDQTSSTTSSEIDKKKAKSSLRGFVVQNFRKVLLCLEDHHQNDYTRMEKNLPKRLTLNLFKTSLTCPCGHIPQDT